MRIRYVKRVRMSLALSEFQASERDLPADITLASWRDSLLDVHARVLHAAFCNDLDGRFFPTFRQYEACKGLVEATAYSQRWFKPGWLLLGSRASVDESGVPTRFYGAVHTTKTDRRVGEIQNISVLPGSRRRGYGRALLIGALLAFQRSRFKRVDLDVTALNFGALRLYLGIGFREVGISFTESFVDDAQSDNYRVDDVPEEFVERVP